MTREIALTLRPASIRGWFGGHARHATDPLSVEHGVTLRDAADALQEAFDGRGAPLVAVLAEYEGACTVVRFGRVEEAAPEMAAPGAAEARVRDSGLAPPGSDEPADRGAPLILGGAWDLSARDYRHAVSEVRERIAAGDVYVLNLTGRFVGRLQAPTAEAAFGVLTCRAEADMAALLTGLPGATPWIASVSPERFLRVRMTNGSLQATVAPIKGTRPRGATQASDEALASELFHDAKERAEHLMVVDLERNDLGAVCVPGSVNVDPLYEVISTPYCHQLVSEVHGVLQPDLPFARLLEATFPCGSVTGAPKIAAMRIAAQAEASRRGPYCGALLVAVPGELDSSVLIRTLEGVADTPEQARWGSGCGITHDSDPAFEYLEMLLKASPVTGDGAPPVALRETMRLTDGRIPLLDLHLARLSAGGCGPSVLARVRESVAAHAGGANPDSTYARVGVTVTPDGEVCTGVSRERSSLEVEGGPRIAAVEVAQLPVLPPSAAKPASRRYWDRAHRAARMSGADQAILHTRDGVLIDGSTATLWLVRDGALLTPPAPPAIAGVARELVFDIAHALRIPARECALRLADLDSADEVFLSNGVGLVVGVRDRTGPVTRRIAEASTATLVDRDCLGG